MTDQEKINFLKAAIEDDASLIKVLREIVNTNLDGMATDKLDILVELLGVQ